MSFYRNKCTRHSVSTWLLIHNAFFAILGSAIGIEFRPPDWGPEMNRASHDFQIFVKPTGSICNLGCDYCYYLNKELLYPERSSYHMPDDILESYIAQHIR